MSYVETEPMVTGAAPLFRELRRLVPRFRGDDRIEHEEQHGDDHDQGKSRDREHLLPMFHDRES